MKKRGSEREKGRGETKERMEKETKQIGWEWFLPFTRLWALVSKKAETNWKRRGWGMTETRTSRRTHSRGSEQISRAGVRYGYRITLSLSLHWQFGIGIGILHHVKEAHKWSAEAERGERQVPGLLTPVSERSRFLCFALVWFAFHLTIYRDWNYHYLSFFVRYKYKSEYA